MSLPRPPISLNTPIPNQPFSADEVYYLEGNQGRLPLGNGLYIDPATGEFTDVEPSPYIYCVPQFGNLPVTYPPYGCETEVNTAGVTDFTDAWKNCTEITEFPCVDSSIVTNFTYAWYGCENLTSFPKLNTSAGINFSRSWNYCYGLTSFPEIDTSYGEDFYNTWAYTGITSFPVLDFSRGGNFNGTWTCNYFLESFPNLNLSSGLSFLGTWDSCYGLTTFPLIDVSSGTNFSYAWNQCDGLTSFPAGMFNNCSAINFSNSWYRCALNQASVDNILISLDTAGQSNGTVGINGGTSSAPGVAGWAAVASLEAKGWTVSVNGTPPPLAPLATTDATSAEPQFPANPEPDQEFTDPATHKKYKWKRARNEKGWFIADDPATPENEAWIWQWLPLDDHTGNTGEAK